MAAYVHCNFHSCILRMQVDVSILLPEKERMEDVEQGKKGETFGKNKKYSVEPTEYRAFCSSSSFDSFVGFGTLPCRLPWFHRADPSTTLDKV